MALTRRDMLCGCGASLLLAACGGGGGDSPTNTPVVSRQIRGCGFSSSIYGAAYPGCGNPISTSGNPNVDAAFAREFASQKIFWQLPAVSFSFLNDCDGPNAYARPDTQAILFGINLGSMVFSTFSSAIPLWQIIAHEFGHQVQFAFGDNWLEAPTVAPKELEADMFSGFYLIIAKTFVSPLEMQAAVANAFALGNFQFNSPSFHGTPQQRAAAVVAGGKVANEYTAGVIPRTYTSVRTRFAQELTFILS